MLVTDPVHVDALDFASSGVYVSADQRQRHAAPRSGRASASATIRRAAQAVTVDTVVVRADGTIATRLSASSSVPAGASLLLSASAAFPNPHLWNGVADPYLYTVYAEVRVGGGA